MTDRSPLIAEHSIHVQAAPATVWEVLTRSAHIRQWDDVPEHFREDALSAGAVLEWAGYAVLTVIEYAPPHRLRMAYHSPTWPRPAEGIEYAYAIGPARSGCELRLRVGDWALAPDGNGREYYDASVDFVTDAAAKIRDIAERQ
ncbi:SRPBCC family protein [Luteimonas sp. SDU82]|uniref:SRPBCC family protein n=1 Tax=Luteimonas sp. SDU82 TaxID=3422592 RepID=UPI003EBD13C9